MVLDLFIFLRYGYSSKIIVNFIFKLFKYSKICSNDSNETNEGILINLFIVILNNLKLDSKVS